MALVRETIGASASVGSGVSDTQLSTGNFTNSIAIGDYIAVFSGGFDPTGGSSGTTTSVTDTLGNTYTSIAVAGGVNRLISLWYTRSTASGTNAVTANYTQESPGGTPEAYNQAIRAYHLDGTLLRVTPPGAYNSDPVTTVSTLSGTGTASYGTTSPAGLNSLHITGIHNAATLTVGAGFTSGGAAGSVTCEHKTSTANETFTWSGGSAGTAYSAVGASFALIQPPNPTSVSPAFGRVAGGTAVTITGTDFQSGATVKFDTTSATSVVFVSATTLTCVTPAHSAGAVNVVVTNPDTQTGTLVNGYTYADPTVTSTAPNESVMNGGISTTITGTWFQSGAAVTFNGAAATSVVVTNQTTITCTVPANPGAPGSVDVVATVLVTNPDGGSGNNAVFTWRAPTLDAVSIAVPTVGGVAKTVTGNWFASGAQLFINGVGTGTTFNSITSLSFDAIPAYSPFRGVETATSNVGDGVADTTLVTSGTEPVLVGDVVLVFLQGRSDHTGTTGTPSGVSDNLGTTYTQVGSKFDLTNRLYLRVFAGQVGTAGNATFTGTFNQTGTEGYSRGMSVHIFVNDILPDGILSINSDVVTQSGTVGSDGVALVGSTAPLLAGNIHISAIVRDSAVVGAIPGFTGLAATERVIVSALSSMSSGSETLVWKGFTAGINWIGIGFSVNTVVTTSGQTLKVTNIDGSFAELNNNPSYRVPTITSLTPADVTVAGGQTVTVAGTWYAPSWGFGETQLTLDDSTSVTEAVPTVTVTGTSSDPTSEITFSTPSHAISAALLPDSIPVRVISGLVASATSNLTYHAPEPASVTPRDGPVAGGISVTVAGNYFTGSSSADFGGTEAASFNVANDTTITCVVPAHASGAVNVDINLIVSATTYTGTIINGFTYRPPSPLSVTPNSGPTGGGTPVTIVGNYFTGADRAFFGGALATSFVATSDTVATCTTPSHAYGSVDVVVDSDVSGIAYSGILEDGYYYMAQGWWRSDDSFTTNATPLVSTDSPTVPRSFTELTGFATGNADYLGGSPSCATSRRNRLIYASGGYSVGTTAPSLRYFNGTVDFELGTVPSTTSGAVSKAVLSMLGINNTIYLSTFDSGTSYSTWAGRVFELDIRSGNLTQIGDDVFTSGHMPYALAWHQGKLWVGTNRQDPTQVGRVYWIRPGVDTAWTLDHTLTGTQGSVVSMLSTGHLYVGCMSASGVAALLLKRDSSTGTYSTDDTMPGSSFSNNNGFIALTEFNGDLYSSAWNPGLSSAIRKYSGGWSSVYSVTGGSALPFTSLAVDDGFMYGIGAKALSSPSIVRTANGTAFTDVTSFLGGSVEPIGPAWGVIAV